MISASAEDGKGKQEASEQRHHRFFLHVGTIRTEGQRLDQRNQYGHKDRDNNNQSCRGLNERILRPQGAAQYIGALDGKVEGKTKERPPSCTEEQFPTVRKGTSVSPE